MAKLDLHLENLRKRFGETEAVAGVHLAVAAGSFTALLGPSGCGKTTALRMIAGLEEPDEGVVRIGERVLSDAGSFVPPHQRRIGMVFQDYALFPHLDVAGNVGYGLEGDAARETRIGEVLELVHLSAYRDRMPHDLSGGEQQRVALARALAIQPDLILLDEPFSNLDARLRESIREEVSDIVRGAGVTTVLVTHDQEEALSLADEVALMFDGKIVQCAAPETMYREPVSEQAALFLGEANVLSATANNGQLDCELGRLEPRHPGAQGEARIMFRPEELQLEKAETGRGEVCRVEYFGHDLLVEVRLDSGTRLRSRDWGPHARFRKGDRVELRVNAPVTVF